jgi:hypothetical protein
MNNKTAGNKLAKSPLAYFLSNLTRVIASTFTAA